MSEFHRSIHQVTYSKISKNLQQSSFQKQLQQNIILVIRVLAAITTDSINKKLMELQQELVKKTTTRKLTMRLPTRFLHSEKSISKLQRILYRVMNNCRELQNCRISLKTSLPTLQYLMKPL